MNVVTVGNMVRFFFFELRMLNQFYYLIKITKKKIIIIIKRYFENPVYIKKYNNM